MEIRLEGVMYYRIDASRFSRTYLMRQGQPNISEGIQQGSPISRGDCNFENQTEVAQNHRVNKLWLA